MFVSTNYLVRNYGVDAQIAKFFVDRDPPVDNLYWYEKLLYLRPAPGYLFIPLIVDLLHNAGIEKDQLLSERFVSVMEQVGHVSALEETKQITDEKAIAKCMELLADRCENPAWLSEVTAFFSKGGGSIFDALTTPFKALHRGDVFLFSLSALRFPESLFLKVSEQWFALISTLLLLDDAEDIQTDKASGDENAFIESGLNADGLQNIVALVQQNIAKINTVNTAVGSELERQFKDRMQKPDILKLFNC